MMSRISSLKLLSSIVFYGISVHCIDVRPALYLSYLGTAANRLLYPRSNGLEIEILRAITWQPGHIMGSRNKKRSTSGAYSVTLICSLEVAMSAARHMLHKEHARLHPEIGGTDRYILGQLGPHNVAIVSLLAGY